jgi:hypothetical protein
MELKGRWSLKEEEYVVERNTCRKGENCTNKTLRQAYSPPTTFRPPPLLGQYFGPQTEKEHTIIFYDTPRLLGLSPTTGQFDPQ